MNRIHLAAVAAAIAAVGNVHAQTVIGGGKAGVSFPIVISQPGSYKLSGNLTVPAGVNGIEIAASNVTLDLNGYTITGPVNCAGSWYAMTCSAGGGKGIVYADGNAMFTTVRNGHLRGFATAIHLGSSAQLEDLGLHGNGDYGLIAQSGSIVRNVRATYNRTAGMSVGQGVISHSSSTYSPIGFSMTSGLLIASTTDVVNVGVYGSYGGAGSAAGVRESVLRAMNAPMNGTALSLGNNLCNGIGC